MDKLDGTVVGEAPRRSIETRLLPKLTGRYPWKMKLSNRMGERSMLGVGAAVRMPYLGLVDQ